MGAAGQQSISRGRTYTAGRRQPYLIRKWPGSAWTIPLGPYTLTQLVVLVGSIVTLVQTRTMWAHFGPINLVIAVGVPIVLTYAARHTRIEGRDPLRAAVAGVGYLLQPRAGYLRGQGWRAPSPVRTGGGAFAVVDLDTLLDGPVSAAAPAPARVRAAVTGSRRTRCAAVPAAAVAGPGRASLADLLTTVDTGGNR